MSAAEKILPNNLAEPTLHAWPTSAHGSALEIKKRITNTFSQSVVS
jgi:hypothetical protein